MTARIIDDEIKLIKILFVCHGNICRSVSAEYILKDKISKGHLQDRIYCESRATSLEEIGNDIYPPMKKTLQSHLIPLERHFAKRIEEGDYERFDLILLMDSENMYSIRWIIKDDPMNKIHLLTEYVLEKGEIEDPWYTRNFEKVYRQIDSLIDKLIKKII